MENIRKHNAEFVKTEGYKPYETSKYPDRKIAVVGCMDTRLVTLLPAALGIRNGEVNMIKNAGGIILDPFGEGMRSLMVAVYELGVERILIIGHTGCGARGMKGDHFIEEIKARGIPQATIDTLKAEGHDVEGWLTTFDDTEEAVRRSVEIVKNHPLMPGGIEVEGFIIDTLTGELKGA